MADIKNCKRCGKPFFSRNCSDVFCENCAQDEHKLYKDLREYIIDNPGTSAYDLSQVFNVRIDRITRYIRDNKLNPL